MADTKKSGVVQLHELIKIVEENDSHYFNEYKKILSRVIKNSSRRILNVNILIDIYKRKSLREKLVLGKKIKDKELLKDFFFMFPGLKGDEKELLSFNNLKEAFRKKYGKRDQYPLYEKFFNERRSLYIENIKRAEEIRKSYLSQSAWGGKNRDKIIQALEIAPFGAKRIVGELLYDLLQSILGVGKFGEFVTYDMLLVIYKKADPIVRQYNHPTLQGWKIEDKTTA